MSRYLLHRHEPDVCGVPFASFNGHKCPLSPPAGPGLVPLRGAGDLAAGGCRQRRPYDAHELSAAGIGATPHGTDRSGPPRQSPGRFVERVRLDAARADLEAGDDTLDVVAERCGLGNPESLRRVFHRHLGVSPGACWRRFRTTTPHQGAFA